MDVVIRNPEKKYPIVPEQIQTGREGCDYCRQSTVNQIKPDNTEKCYFCGFESQEKMNGLLIGAFDKMKVPMVLVERVHCEYVSVGNILPKYYYERDSKVYHLISADSFASNVIANSICYKCRELNPWLAENCNRQDVYYAEKAFNAIDNDEENFFNPYPSCENPEFEYHSYACSTSGLAQIIIPIYTVESPQKRSKRGVVGVLMIGQLPVSGMESNMQDGWLNEHMERQSNWTIEQNTTIEKLRKDVWENTSISKYRDIKSALKANAEHIITFLMHMRDEIINREMNFLHIYQSRLIQDFLCPINIIPSEDVTDEKQKAESIRKRVMAMFKRVWEDFDLKDLCIFIPDLELKAIVNNPIVKGVPCDINGDLSIEIDLTNLPESTSYNIDDLVKHNAINTHRKTEQPDESELLCSKKLTEGYYEFFSVAYSSGTDKTMFGVFVEWSSIPFDYDDKQEHHKDFFRALAGICAAEIMAFLASSRATRLSSFAEEARHDLAHRLQTLDSHNTSFSLNTKDFFENKSISVDKYQRFVMIYLQANKELFETLEFMREELDSVNIYREAKPERIMAYSDVLHGLRHLFKAPWHPRNKGHDLIVSPADWFTGRLNADKVMFRRIVANLLDNAFKYSPPKTNVYILQSYDSKNNKICFDIINFCSGIKEDLAEIMFEHGTKGNSATVGKGLGLYIARNFAERNNGTLNIIKGIIPKSGNEKEKIENGLVSTINFTVYNDVLEWTKNNPNNHMLNELKGMLLSKRLELNKPGELLSDISKKIGKPTPLSTIMVDPHDERPTSWRKPTARDLQVYSKHELYQVRFRLSLPITYN